MQLNQTKWSTLVTCDIVNKLRFKLVILFLFGLISACSHTNAPKTNPDAVKQDFTQTIKSLSQGVTPHDANVTAQTLLNASVRLRNEYAMASPALYHNMLVNMGFRERGLCCHWAEDLHAEIRKLNVNSLKFDWLVSRLGSELREHNVIVIYSADSSWQQGVVFDPWRKAGEPYWAMVKGDKYPWELHPLNGRWDVLRCK